MMTFKGDPEFTIVNRLPKSMPQYHGHQILGRFKHILNKHIHVLE